MCVRCNQPIRAGDPITWARRGTKGTLHVSCGNSGDSASNSQPIRNESAVNTQTISVSNSDAGNVFAGFAAMLQPYIQASTDGIEERIQEAIARAIEELTPTTRVTLFDPPFEDQQDLDHIQAAYDRLASDGVLVAILGPSFEYRTNRDSVEFREWLEKVGASWDEIPAGAFKQSGTMVASRLMVIDKRSN